MNRPLTRLAWAAAVATYLLIVLGGIVRITGSGLGCGDQWPICHGRLIPSFTDIATLIEWSHRLVAAMVSTLVVLLAGAVWWTRKRGAGSRERGAGSGERSKRGVGSGEWSERGAGSGERSVPGRLAYLAVGLLIVQVLLGAITVKLHLPPWTVVLHLGTAMLLFATLIATARRLTPSALKRPPAVASPGRIPGSGPGNPPATGAAVLVFVTILMGALTANLGAATACVGFPLCNGQWIVTGNYLQYVQWGHRLLAYTTYAYLLAWTLATRRRAAILVLGVASLQIAIAAALVTHAVPPILAATHVAVGAALWGTAVLTAMPPPINRPNRHAARLLDSFY